MTEITSIETILDLFDKTYGESREFTSIYMQGKHSIIVEARYTDEKVLFRIEICQFLTTPSIKNLTLDSNSIMVADNKYPVNINPIIETIIAETDNYTTYGEPDIIKWSITIGNELLEQLFKNITGNITATNEIIKAHMEKPDLTDEETRRANTAIDYVHRYQSLAVSIKNQIYKNNRKDD